MEDPGAFLQRAWVSLVSALSPRAPEPLQACAHHTAIRTQVSVPWLLAEGGEGRGGTQRLQPGLAGGAQRASGDTRLAEGKTLGLGGHLSGWLCDPGQPACPL